jgi:hypothetical protein
MVHVVTNESELKKWIQEPNRIVLVCYLNDNTLQILDNLSKDNMDVIFVKIDINEFKESDAKIRKILPIFTIYFNEKKISEWIGVTIDIGFMLSKARLLS